MIAQEAEDPLELDLYVFKKNKKLHLITAVIPGEEQICELLTNENCEKDVRLATFRRVIVNENRSPREAGLLLAQTLN